jgi:hypothetical protein
VLRARVAAYHSHLRYSRGERTAAARAAFRDRFAQQIRAEHPGLSEAEIERRAAIARRAWYAGLAYKSAKVRARKKAAPAIRSPGTAGLEAGDVTAERPAG